MNDIESFFLYFFEFSVAERDSEGRSGVTIFPGIDVTFNEIP